VSRTCKVARWDSFLWKLRTFGRFFTHFRKNCVKNMQCCQMGLIFMEIAHIWTFFSHIFVKTVSRTCNVARWDSFLWKLRTFGRFFTHFCKNSVPFGNIAYSWHSFYENYAHLDVFFVKTVSRTCNVARWDSFFMEIAHIWTFFSQIFVKTVSRTCNVARWDSLLWKLRTFGRFFHTFL